MTKAEQDYYQSGYDDGWAEAEKLYKPALFTTMTAQPYRRGYSDGYSASFRYNQNFRASNAEIFIGHGES